MNACIFCSIIAKQAPADIIYQDEQVTAFRDIHPVAPLHILIVPSRHIATTNDLQDEDQELIGRLVITARKLAAQLGVANNGYRLILNTGHDGGQAVYHLHLHLIAGRRMRYPMG